MRKPFLPFLAFLVATSFVVLPACGGEEEEPDIDPDTLIGDYVITTFEFDPTGTLIPTFNLATNLEEFSVELLDGNQVLMRFRVAGSSTEVLTGTYSTGPETATLRFGESFGDELATLLLPRTITFDYSTAGGGTLLYETEKENADLEDLTGEGGSFDGTLTLEIRMGS